MAPFNCGTLGKETCKDPHFIANPSCNFRKSSVAPANQIRKAHQPVEISSIAFSHVGASLLTRSLDETMKLWDLRNFKTAVNEVGSLFARYDTTDAIFSPNDCIVATAMSLRKGTYGG